MQSMRLKFKIICLVLLGVSLQINAQEGKVHIDQNRDISTLLEFKKDLSTVDLYKIQVYQGNRSGAEDAKSKFASTYDEWPISMVYETPNYKIWVGNFRSRLEADRALIKIKKNYTSAFIFKPKNLKENTK